MLVIFSPGFSGDRASYIRLAGTRGDDATCYPDFVSRERSEISQAHCETSAAVGILDQMFSPTDFVSKLLSISINLATFCLLDWVGNIWRPF